MKTNNANKQLFFIFPAMIAGFALTVFLVYCAVYNNAKKQQIRNAEYQQRILTSGK